jgi:tetratricopeptide (TPR) repeat protein
MPKRPARAEWVAFVSHASEDDRLATRITRDLTKNRLSVWIDHEKLRRRGLLLEALQTAIERCSHVVLLWSEDSAGSRYVTAEWNFAWNRELPIVPCRVDATKLPLGLAGYLYCDFRTSFETGAGQLREALSGRGAAPPPREEVPAPGRKKETLDRNTAVRSLFEQQASVLEALDRGDVTGAGKIQRQLDRTMIAAERRFPHDADVLELAGYHLKNAYQIKHWDAIQARESPADRLLGEAEGRFWEALQHRPDDASALNGLGSVLALRGDLDAAEFYVRRAIARARVQGYSYPYAEEDLRTIRREKALRARRPAPGRSRA